MNTIQPPQDCRSRGDCGIPLTERGARWQTASRLPQSRRLRLHICLSIVRRLTRLKIAVVAATAALRPDQIWFATSPPQDCRSRGDCGFTSKIFKSSSYTASRLPQSRRLRRRDNLFPDETTSRLKIAAVAATAAPRGRCSSRSPCSASRLPQSRRLRRSVKRCRWLVTRPPQDCRSRGDCGVTVAAGIVLSYVRLKIAAVAATAARLPSPPLTRRWPASRLPQSRRLRHDRCEELAIRHSRLKIAAVAATAAAKVKPHCSSSLTASRLPQSRRLRLWRWLK